MANSHAEVEEAQDLRRAVFQETFGSDFAMATLDADRFDAICDHLLVRDQQEAGRIVGTYRLLRQEVAASYGGFYSTSEFEIDRLVARHPSLHFLELGRSCVLPPYRSRRTIELLWQGIWAYVRLHRIDVMAGCASFAGTIPAAHAQALSYLHHFCRAAGAWSVRAVPSRRVDMDMVPREACGHRQAMRGMPALIKGYLRLGGKVGEGCVVDTEFGTTDIFIVLPVADLSHRYVSYYGADATRFAA